MSNRYKSKPITDTKHRFRPNMAADGVVFALFDTDKTDKRFYSGEAHVLLIKRGAVESTGPNKGKPRGKDNGYWALPGGFVESQQTLEEAVINELVEETVFPKNEFLSAYKNKVVGLQQIKTYSAPKRDSWNFNKDVKLGEHKRTITTSFLVTVPNTMFTLNLAYANYYLKNNKILPIDFDIFLPYSGVSLETDFIKKFLNEDGEYDFIDKEDELSEAAWNTVHKQNDPNKFLQKAYSLGCECY